MDIGGALTGFIVDSVAEVIRISAAEIQPPPQLVSGNTVHECVTGVVNHAERLLIVLDMVKLFTPQELSSLQW
jgi:purine-binding chemotaxis protein CheW